MTILPPGGRAGPPSRLLIHADEPGQANRLALLVSHYGHRPQILDLSLIHISEPTRPY